jgi:hypothetical protein
LAGCCCCWSSPSSSSLPSSSSSSASPSELSPSPAEELHNQHGWVHCNDTRSTLHFILILCLTI